MSENILGEEQVYMVRAIVKYADAPNGEKLKTTDICFAATSDFSLITNFIVGDLEDGFVKRYSEKLENFFAGKLRYIKVPSEEKYIVRAAVQRNEMLQVAEIVNCIRRA